MTDTWTLNDDAAGGRKPGDLPISEVHKALLGPDPTTTDPTAPGEPFDEAAATRAEYYARTFELPAEPDGPLWYPDGTKFVRLPPPPEYGMHAHHWVRAGERATWHGGLNWRQLLGAAAHPLSTTPPTGTEGER